MGLSLKLHVALGHRSIVDFVDFDLIDRIVGVSTYHPPARIRSAVLNHEERAPPAVVQGAAPGFRMVKHKS